MMVDTEVRNPRKMEVRTSTDPET
jgi:hypothetical protein